MLQEIPRFKKEKQQNQDSITTQRDKPKGNMLYFNK